MGPAQQRARVRVSSHGTQKSLRGMLPYATYTTLRFTSLAPHKNEKQSAIRILTETGEEGAGHTAGRVKCGNANWGEANSGGGQQHLKSESEEMQQQHRHVIVGIHSRAL